MKVVTCCGIETYPPQLFRIQQENSTRVFTIAYYQVLETTPTFKFSPTSHFHNLLKSLCFFFAQTALVGLVQEFPETTKSGSRTLAIVSGVPFDVRAQAERHGDPIFEPGTSKFGLGRQTEKAN